MGSQRVGRNLGTEQLKQQPPNLPVLPRFYHKSHPTLVLQHHMYPNVHRSTVYNSQDMETTYMSISRWMDKKAVVRKPGGLLCHVAYSLRCYGNGVRFQVISGQSSCLCPYFAQFRPLLVACYLSAKMDSSVRVSGRLAGHILGWCLLPPFGLSHILPNSPSWLLLVFFFFFLQHCVPYWDLLLWDNSGK